MSLSGGVSPVTRDEINWSLRNDSRISDENSTKYELMISFADQLSYNIILTIMTPTFEDSGDYTVTVNATFSLYFELVVLGKHVTQKLVI